VQEIEEMRRRLRQMEEQDILPAVTAAVSHGKIYLAASIVSTLLVY
jgi:hypothetical protein